MVSGHVLAHPELERTDGQILWLVQQHLAGDKAEWDMHYIIPYLIELNGSYSICDGFRSISNGTH
jgi:hypothetical protein